MLKKSITLKEQFAELYRNMLNDIEKTVFSGTPELDRITNCFWIVINYWRRLKEEIGAAILKVKRMKFISSNS
jgi:hypothetical protein